MVFFSYNYRSHHLRGELAIFSKRKINFIIDENVFVPIFVNLF